MSTRLFEQLYPNSMYKFLPALFFVFHFLSTDIHAQSHGLIFFSFEVEKEKRTCLQLTADEPLQLKSVADISFELSFIPGRGTYFGYIFRLINQHDQNIDLVFKPKGSEFSLVLKEDFTQIRFSVDSLTLSRAWSLFRLHRDGTKLSFYVNDKKVGETSAALLDDDFKIYFGACNQRGFRTTDIPPMKLRNIRISQASKLALYWPLDEDSGTVCVDSVHGKQGLVVNPLWIAPLHTRWKKLRSFTVKSNASVAFDAATEQVYITALDSVYSFAPARNTFAGIPVHDKKEYLQLGNQSFFNPFDKHLYNLFIERSKPSRFDTASGKWTNPADGYGLTRYWQSNKFVAAGNVLYVFGGYGYLMYNNNVQRMRFPDDTLEIIKPGGDFFAPRYLAALGANAAGDTAYILGGYGSTTGEQALNPRYMYDLLRYDVKRNTFKKLVTLKEPAEPFVFGNSLVLDPDNSGNYYALAFPNDRFNSSLQLIKGNIRSSAYEPVGDTIPYSFNDIRSYADLYFCHETQQLLAVTLLRNEAGNTTDVNIFSIAFPPNAWTVVKTHPSKPVSPFVYIAIASVTIILLLAFFFYRRKPRQIAPPAPPPFIEEVPPALPDSTKPEGPAILLFGPFEVIGRNQENITKLFTPLLKELFLLITIFTAKTGRGIPTANLNEILWSDKTEKDAKNNRSVNLAKLKTILEKLGDCTITKESERWMLKYNPDEIKIDMVAFLRFTRNKHGIDKSSVEQLLQIVRRGAFLHQTEYDWLDDIKSEISNEVLDLLVETGNTLQPGIHAEQMIEIAQLIFQFDQVNEHALALKCKGLNYLGRHSLANNTYEKFTRDYRHMYGEDFNQTYHAVISDPNPASEKKSG